eukprot:76602-Ditylum_brightwellii.AAC.1
MVIHNTTPAKAIRASYSKGFNHGPQEDKEEWAAVGKVGKPEENDQGMMEEDRKKEEKRKLAVDANDDGIKGTGIKAATSAKEAMR